MSDKYTIGIDPGLTGAIAVLDPSGKLVLLDDMPLNILPPKSTGRIERVVDVVTLSHIFNNYKPSNVIVEAVCSRPGEGHMGAFTFGKGYGALLAAVDLTNGTNRIDVNPNTWKKKLGLTSDKILSRQMAIEEYPLAKRLLGRRKDEGRAEALLLAMYYLRYCC